MTLTQIMIVDDGRNRMRTYEIVVGSKESESQEDTLDLRGRTLG